MKKFENVMHTWMFGKMTLPDVCRDVKACGFDGLDLTVTAGNCYNIDNYKTSNILQLAKDYGLSIPTSTCDMPPEYNDLTHCDETIRTKSIDFVKAAIDASSFAGAKRMLLLPSGIGRLDYHVSKKADWAQSVNSVRICAEHAKKQGVSILLEPLNRHRANLIRSVGEGVEMVKDVGMDNVFVVPDVYHINNEDEMSIPATIYKYAPYIKNFHVADSSRRAPGTGSYNWGEILQALDAVGYDGPLSYEPVYRDFSPMLVATDEQYRARFLHELTCGVAFMNSKMDAMQAI